MEGAQLIGIDWKQNHRVYLKSTETKSYVTWLGYSPTWGPPTPVRASMPFRKACLINSQSD